jgi:hypothetical protein
MPCRAVYSGHVLNLSGPLLHVLLVYAQRINPQFVKTILASNTSETQIQTLGHSDGNSIDQGSTGADGCAPDVGKSIVLDETVQPYRA